MKRIPLSACQDERFGWQPPLMFPNPATNLVHLQIYPSEIGILNLRVFDMAGRELMRIEEPVNEINTLDFTFEPRSFGLRNGVYIFQIEGSGINQSKKLVLH
jgi:hypothetical protein